MHSSCTSMSSWWQNNPSLWPSWAASIPKWVSIIWHTACSPSDAKLMEGGVEKDTQQLEAIQGRAARFVVQDFSRYSSVQSYLNDLKWAHLKDRRRDIRLTFLFKIVTGRVAVQAEGTLLPADSRTRHKHKHKYRHLPATCNQCLNSFFVKTIPDWNSPPPPPPPSFGGFFPVSKYWGTLPGYAKKRLRGQWIETH